MLKLDWEQILTRYTDNVSLSPLAGSSPMTASVLGDDAVLVRHKLWQALITREHLNTAVAVLDRTPKPVTAVEFAEHLRAFYTSTTDCSRIPNLSAVILADLGLLPA